MCKLKISIMLIFQIFAFSLCGQLLTRKPIKITRLDVNCPGKNVPSELYLKVGKCDTVSAFVLNSTVVIKETMSDNNLKYTIKFQRCHTRESLDTCELILKQEDGNYCQVMNPDNKIIGKSPFVVPYIPKMKCPFKKGVYHAYNFTLSLTPLILFPIDNWYWKIEFELYLSDKSRLLACGNIEAHTVLRPID